MSNAQIVTQLPTPPSLTRQLALSDIALRMAVLLGEAHKLQGGIAPLAHEYARILTACERLVNAEAPSARENAMTAARMAAKVQIELARVQAYATICDHSSALLCDGALRTMAQALYFTAAESVLSAYNGSLDDAGGAR